LASQKLSPTISILGDSEKIIKRSESLVLNSFSFVETFSSKIYSNFLYNWTVFDSSTRIIKRISSSSQNPSSFVVKPFSFESNIIYQITLLVTYIPLQTSTSISVFLIVQSGNIVVIIADGNIKQVQMMTNFTVDASKSYDEDTEVRSTSFKNLTFSWSCIQIQPVFISQCPLQFLSGGPILSVYAPSSSTNKTSRVTVVISDRRLRSSSYFIDVSVTSEKVSELFIGLSESKSQQSININQNLLLTGSLLVVDSCSALWSVDDTLINLKSSALTPLSQTLVTGTKTIFPLLIASGSLPQRTSLTISLSCGSSKTSIIIITNGSPLPGVFIVLPTEGIELTTSFEFSASYWSDPNIPLFYQFGFISQSSLVNLVILSMSELSFDSSTLPVSIINIIIAIILKFLF
jgi:hypothetical protein